MNRSVLTNLTWANVQPGWVEPAPLIEHPAWQRGCFVDELSQIVAHSMTEPAVSSLKEIYWTGWSCITSQVGYWRQNGASRHTKFRRNNISPTLLAFEIRFTTIEKDRQNKYVIDPGFHVYCDIRSRSQMGLWAAKLYQPLLIQMSISSYFWSMATNIESKYLKRSTSSKVSPLRRILLLLIRGNPSFFRTDQSRMLFEIKTCSLITFPG